MATNDRDKELARREATAKACGELREKLFPHLRERSTAEGKLRPAMERWKSALFRR